MSFRLFLQLFVCLLIISTAQSAHAGFEWIPPNEIMKHETVTPKHSSEVTNDIPLPVAPDMPPAGGVPAPSVSAMPLDLNASAQQSGGLQINPYPQDQNPSPGDALVGVGPVEQAMMEVSQDLNPAPLGHGFTTAPKPDYKPSARVVRKKEVESVPLTPPPSSGMTDFPDEEPMPLNTPRGPVMASRAIDMPQARAPMPAPAPAPVAMPVPMRGFDEVQGFGRDLPLALALTQVIPSNYALAFETGVNPGASVSWEGGRPWNEVLNDMLGQVGLSADISGKVVRVSGA